jgi:hypothetical protein
VVAIGLQLALPNRLALQSGSVGATSCGATDVVAHCGDDCYGQPKYRLGGGMERNSRTMALPTLTAEQCEEALRKAQAARLARKQLLAAIATGEQTIPAVLDRAKTDAIVGRTKVVDLLKSHPGWGPAKVTALKQTGIGPRPNDLAKTGVKELGGR